MTTSAKEREEAVRQVLADALVPLGPTEIGRLIGQPWSVYDGRPHWGNSSALTPVLRRIGAVRHKGGKYTKPVGQEQGQEGESRGE